MAMRQLIKSASLRQTDFYHHISISEGAGPSVLRGKWRSIATGICW